MSLNDTVMNVRKAEAAQRAATRYAFEMMDQARNRDRFLAIAIKARAAGQHDLADRTAALAAAYETGRADAARKAAAARARWDKARAALA